MQSYKWIPVIVLWMIFNVPVTLNSQIWQKIDPNMLGHSVGSVIALEAPSKDVCWLAYGYYNFPGSLWAFNGTILKSSDAGITWKESSLPADNETRISYFKALDDKVAYLCTYSYGNNKVFVTMDGGNIWKDVTPQSLLGAYYSFIHFWTPEKGILALGYNTGSGTGIYLTNDGGDHWNPVEESKFPGTKIVLPKENAFMVTDSSITIIQNECSYFSFDYGVNWTKSNEIFRTLAFPSTEFCFYEESILDSSGFGVAFCSDFGQMYTNSYYTHGKYTNNSGKTWLEYTNLPDQGKFFVNTITNVPGTETLILNGIYPEEKYKTYVSTDKGEKWSLIDQGTIIRFMKFLDNQNGWGAWSGHYKYGIYGAGGDYKVYKYVGPPLDELTGTIESPLNSFSTYPNPATSFIKIQIEKNNEPVSFKLIDIFGNQIPIHLNRINDYLFEINVANISSGQYALVVQFKKSVQVKNINIVR